MLFTTTTQYVALAVALVAGWLLGLASHPGGARWKQRYAEEREAHAVARREHEARLAEARTRASELERENVRLAKAAPVTAATIAPAASERAGDTAYAPESGRGWFNWRNRVTNPR
jgi:hypothetical protein